MKNCYPEKIKEIDVSKLSANKRGKLLTFYKPTAKRKQVKSQEPAKLLPRQSQKYKAAMRLKFIQDGIIAQQAFEANVRYLNRIGLIKFG